ncbi:MAG TPA: hypothetical protein VHK69_20015 [Chitinophagaceae bacterium]|jgi:VIT1/CCC1 family predicted Fe2+/Mn2+ transporter|nr:hypothetical protein [Chitinophagaceae bacterium]
MSNHSSLRAGTTGGTLLILLTSLTGTDILRTVVLGAIGAAVSYLVSYLLKKLLRN